MTIFQVKVPLRSGVEIGLFNPIFPLFLNPVNLLHTQRTEKVH